MRTKSIILQKKSLLTDTGWRRDDIRPQFFPIFLKTRPVRSDWMWRSAEVHGAELVFVLFARANPKKDNWQSILILEIEPGIYTTVSRFEYHGAHPGLHVHSDCKKQPKSIKGPESLSELERIPSSGRFSFHRRIRDWSPNKFWEESKRFFRVDEIKGGLL